ncbi:hypothetical protein CXIVA_16620 [Clostridium sp. SY8519]|uniref:DUF1934 domain-containing protein n=1 Tax=Clostridium sp. (strain SY8519) TaxID=1042156 RepID=UPI0002171C02|nr:DUF1934 domain-containing protein [Clostridium sp. SY8519]BAK47628.1 hypothetical protein CXIVA_16620 [Clostridium sp. SY8519]
MTREVLIRICSRQTARDASGDQQQEEVLVSGEYFFRNGRHYLLYEEVQEGFSDTSRSRIRFDGESLDIRKQGIASTRMIFVPGEKKLTCYETPFGGIMLGIFAKDIRLTESEDEINLQVSYTMEIEDRPHADCVVSVNIRPKYV